MSERGAITFFNAHQAATVEAMTARIIPGTPADPGAREADVIVYVDRELQPLDRRGVEALDRRAHEAHGATFVDCTDEQQDAMLADLLAEVAPTLDTPGVDEDTSLIAYFGAVVHQHTIEGMFGDPAYGGNRDGAGWKLLGFPGARWGYSAEEMRYGYDSGQIPVTTLEDLRRQRAARR